MTMNESDMLPYVLDMFPRDDYDRFIEAPLGRKRVDVFCLPKNIRYESTCIELKISKWKDALWQAAHNYQLADRSFVALWHKHVDIALRNKSLFDKYGVGIISVSPSGAEELLQAGKPYTSKQSQCVNMSNIERYAQRI